MRAVNDDDRASKANVCRVAASIRSVPFLFITDSCWLIRMHGDYCASVLIVQFNFSVDSFEEKDLSDWQLSVLDSSISRRLRCLLDIYL